MHIISGEDLFNWYLKSIEKANKNNINLLEIEIILTELTELDSLSLKLKSYQHTKQIESKVSLEELNKIWQLRITKRCPIQYLLGECYWRDFRFKVTPDVLIPRPETELIIDLALSLAHKYPHLSEGNFLDLGTGSGAIAIGLASIFPQGQIYAVDKSEGALTIAQENALKYNFEKRINFCHGSWFEPLQEQKNSFSMIVSNPPYIPSQVVLQLQPEVLNHEPRIALDGGEDGLSDIRYLIQLAPDYLSEQGWILLEIMAGQGKEVEQLFKANGNYSNIEIHYDLANLDRFVVAQINE
jgi:release factor glutamine methyltransferase